MCQVAVALNFLVQLTVACGRVRSTVIGMLNDAHI